MSRAEYMREYRLKRKGRTVEFFGRPDEIIPEAARRIMDLEAEVARLKRELAKRPDTITVATPVRVTIGQPRPESFQEFRPAPKK